MKNHQTRTILEHNLYVNMTPQYIKFELNVPKGCWGNDQKVNDGMTEWQKGLIGIGRGHKNGLNMTLSLSSGTSTLYELLVYQVWSTSSKMFSIFKVNDTPMLIQIQFINTLRYVTSKQRRDFYFVGVMYKFWCQSSKEL